MKPTVKTKRGKVVRAWVVMLDGEFGFSHIVQFKKDIPKWALYESTVIPATITYDTPSQRTKKRT